MKTEMTRQSLAKSLCAAYNAMPYGTWGFLGVADYVLRLLAGQTKEITMTDTKKPHNTVAPDGIDTESADFKEGFAVGRAESEHLCEMIKSPTCHRCGAISAKDAETKCRPGGMCGDECPGTEWPLSKLWATPPASAPEVSADVTGSLERIRIAADNGGMNEGQCYSIWRTLTAALQQQEGKSHG